MIPLVFSPGIHRNNLKICLLVCFWLCPISSFHLLILLAYESGTECPGCLKGRANVLLRSNKLGSFYAICAFENKLGKNRVNPNSPSKTLPHHIYPHQIPGLACGLAPCRHPYHHLLILPPKPSFI